VETQPGIAVRYPEDISFRGESVNGVNNSHWGGLISHPDTSFSGFKGGPLRMHKMVVRLNGNSEGIGLAQFRTDRRRNIALATLISHDSSMQPISRSGIS
jgi:hypothetical protein